MKAIILAANDNPQLRPLNLQKPGALIKINGIPLLEHQIRGYNRAGVETASISVVSGYEHGQIKRYLKREHPDIHLVRNPDYRSASALYSLDLALQIAEPCAADEGLCISSGECIYDDAAIERVLSVSGSALAVDSSRYVASSRRSSTSRERSGPPSARWTTCRRLKSDSVVFLVRQAMFRPRPGRDRVRGEPADLWHR